MSPQTLMGLRHSRLTKWSDVLRTVLNRTHQATVTKEGSRAFRLVGPPTLSEREAIYSPVGAYVEPILGRDQRLEMMKPGHCGN
jgi:hypothetical protein